MRVSLPPSYDRAAVARFYDRLVDDVQALPGVQAAAAVSQLPLSGAMLCSTFLTEATSSADRARRDADLRGISPDYFRTLDISAAGPWASPPLLSLSSSRARAGCLPGARLESIRQ